MHFGPLFFEFKVTDNETCQVCYHGTRFFKLQEVLKVIRRMYVLVVGRNRVCYVDMFYLNFCQSSTWLLAEFLFNWHVAQGNISITGFD